jgi:elongation factor G
MSCELNVATTRYLDEDYSFIDCPGSIEFLQEMRGALPAVDAAVVVCEADERKLPQLQLILRELEEAKLPHLIFLNKIDKADKRLFEALSILQPASSVPLLMRQIPIWKDGIVVGFVDLALERAFVYREHAPSEVVPLDGDERLRERDARFSMLETLADHDDALMEELLEEIEPPRDRVFDDLSRELCEGSVCPVMIGSALRGNGLSRLLKALRHEVPGIAATRARLGISADAPSAYVVKTVHGGHGGKLSIARVLAGEIAEGAPLVGELGVADRVSGVLALSGNSAQKRGPAGAGELVGLARIDHAATGEVVSARGGASRPINRPEPVLSLAVAARDRKDEVKLGLALSRLAEEDPSLMVRQDAARGEILLGGQGEMHLRVAVERLSGRFGVAVTTRTPRIGYREAIKRGTTQRGRHKKQSGGHGQFGDVLIDVKPLERGEGFRFTDAVTGGAVPRQYISSVEEGVKEALQRGPLGFPVVDIHVTLTDGSYHTVDSSDQAFRAAARIAIAEALPNCVPVLLEPIHELTVAVPGEATAKVNAILSARRAQILGFEPRPGWGGWDMVRALVPEAEIGDLIVELRSASAGAGYFTSHFDHMAELAGRQAEAVVAAAKAA